MAKFYCPKCNGDMDEVDWGQFRMCEKCFTEGKCVKYKNLRVRKGNTDYFYICNTLEWNYWLNRYYPKATLTMEVEHLNNGLDIRTK